MEETAKGEAIASFVANFDQINELLELDERILRIPISMLTRISTVHDAIKLKRADARVDTLLGMLRNLRKNDSLAPKLQALRNQCVVLAVSHFTSAVRDIFLAAIVRDLKQGTRASLLSETLSLQIGDLLELGEAPARKLAEAIIAKKDISFQDMKSIARAFADFLVHEIPRSPRGNDIIVAQACRHAIVHNSATIDEKLVRQISSAVPRNVFAVLIVGRPIEATDQDIRTIGSSMVDYLHALPG